MTNDRALELAQAALFEQIHRGLMVEEGHEAVDVIQKMRDHEQNQKHEHLSPLFGNQIRWAMNALRRR